jgi:surface carbohydrate biosynthesis protein (TIGR04326 family)
MVSDSLYIIGGSEENLPNEIKNFSKIIFLDKEQEGFKNKFSLIKNFLSKQSMLRKRWLNLQEQVFHKIKNHLDKDEDFSYLLYNIFFEASPMKTNSIYKYFKIQLIIDYIKSRNINKIFLYNVTNDIENFFYLNKNKFNFSIKTLKVEKKKLSFKNLFNTVVKNNSIVILFYYILTEYKKTRKIYPQKCKSNKVVLSYYHQGAQLFDDEFSNIYFERVSSLLKTKYAWLFMYVGDKLKIEKENKLIKKSINSFGFLDAYFNISDFCEIIFNFFRINKKLKSIKTADLFIFKEINYLSLTKKEWSTSLLSLLISGLIYEKKFSNFFKKNTYIKEVIYLMEFQPWEQMLNKVAKKFNIKTKGVIHSIVRPNLMNFYHSKAVHSKLNLPSFVGVNNDFSKSLMIKNGFKSNQILKIEAQRFNYLLKNKVSANFKKKKLRKSILIVTSIIYTETLELLNYFASINIEFEKVYIKEHHLFPVSLIIKSKIKNFPHFEIITGTVLDAFKLSDIVLVANGSSVLLESVLCNKQTVSLFSLSFLPIPSINKAPNLHFIYDSFSLSNKLKKIIYQPAIEVMNKKEDKFLYLNKNLKFWREFIKK